MGEYADMAMSRDFEIAMNDFEKTGKDPFRIPVDTDYEIDDEYE